MNKMNTNLYTLSIFIIFLPYDTYFWLFTLYCPTVSIDI